MVSNLKKIVTDLLDQQDHMGGVLSQSALKSLKEHRNRTASYSKLLFSIVVLVVLFSVWGIATYVENENTLAAFTGAIGISIAGCLELLRRLWRDMTQMGLMMILVEDASESQIGSLLQSLQNKL